MIYIFLFYVLVIDIFSFWFGLVRCSVYECYYVICWDVVICFLGFSGGFGRFYFGYIFLDFVIVNFRVFIFLKKGFRINDDD